MSCTTRWSSPSSSPSERDWSASDCAGFSPITYSARSVPCSIASNMSVRWQPRSAAASARPRRPRTSRAPPASSTSWKPGSLFGQRAHVAAALHVVLAAQRVEAGAVAADVAGEQREVDEREHVVDGVVVLGDAERPAELRAVGAARRRARARGSRPAGTPVTRSASVERVRLDRVAVGVEAGGRALDELACWRGRRR